MVFYRTEMENIILQTVVASVAGVLALASPTPPSATLRSQTEVKKPEKVVHVVQKGDSLSSLATKYFDNKDYWTNIWNDNPEIKNPNLIEENDKIVIEQKEKEEIEKLKPELNERMQPRLIAHVQATVVSSEAKVEAQTAPLPPTSGPLSDAQISFLGQCESGLTANRNSGNGFYGAFQFTIGTWNSMGTGYERADLAPLEVQVDAVQRLVSRSSIFGQFPACSRRMQALGIL